MGDWLGTGAIAGYLRKYRPFQEARVFARSLNLKSQREWNNFCQGQMTEKGTLPPDISASPYKTYVKTGWKSMGDWLGTGTIANQNIIYRPFEDAREFARTLNLKTTTEWKKFCKGQMPEKGALPSNIPSKPNRTYAKSGWLGMGDWLGTGRVANFNKTFRPFKEAREFARSLNFNLRAEWRKFCKGQMPEMGTLPSDIPNAPDLVYKNKGWKGYGDWLGTGVVATFRREYRSFLEARAFVHSLNLKSTREWSLFSKSQMSGKEKLPTDIPATPNKTYAQSGWAGMSDWLGNCRKPRKNSPI
jgi:hypothetical protein